MPHGDTIDTRGGGWATRVCHQSRITKTCSREVGILRLPSAQHLVVITVPLSPRRSTKKPKAKPAPDAWALPMYLHGRKGEFASCRVFGAERGPHFAQVL